MTPYSLADVASARRALLMSQVPEGFKTQAGSMKPEELEQFVTAITTPPQLPLTAEEIRQGVQSGGREFLRANFNRMG